MYVRPYAQRNFTLQASAAVLVFLQIDTAAGAAGVEAYLGPHTSSRLKCCHLETRRRCDLCESVTRSATFLPFEHSRGAQSDL